RAAGRASSGCGRTRHGAAVGACLVERSLGAVRRLRARTLILLAQPRGQKLPAQRVASLGEPALATNILGLAFGGFDGDRNDAPLGQVVGGGFHVEKADVAG